MIELIEREVQLLVRLDAFVSVDCSTRFDLRLMLFVLYMIKIALSSFDVGAGFGFVSFQLAKTQPSVGTSLACVQPVRKARKSSRCKELSHT